MEPTKEDGSEGKDQQYRTIRSTSGSQNNIAVYSNWDVEEPSSRFEQCLAINSENGKWTDRNCHVQLNVICQKKAQRMEDALIGIYSITVPHENTTITEATPVDKNRPTIFTHGVIIAISVSGAFLLVLLLVCCWFFCICWVSRRKKTSKSPLPPPIIISKPMPPSEADLYRDHLGEMAVESMFSFLYESEECHSNRDSNVDTEFTSDDSDGISSSVRSDISAPSISIHNAFFQDTNNMVYVRNSKIGSATRTTNSVRTPVKGIRRPRRFNAVGKQRPHIYRTSLNGPEGHSGDSTLGLIGSSSSSGYGCSPQRHFRGCYTIESEVNSTPTSSSYGGTELSSIFDSSSEQLASSECSHDPMMTSTPTPLARPRSSVAKPHIPIDGYHRSRYLPNDVAHRGSMQRQNHLDHHHDTDLIIASGNSMHGNPHYIPAVTNGMSHYGDTYGTTYVNNVPFNNGNKQTIKEQSAIANIYNNEPQPSPMISTETDSVWI